MTKVSRLITLDPDVNEKLKESHSASGLINTLICQHFKVQEEFRHIDEEKNQRLGELERERQKKLRERMDILSNFIENMTDEQRLEFLEGRKINKWSGMTEYAELKLGVKNGKV